VRRKERVIAVLISLVGAIACLAAVTRFVFLVLWNGLAWTPDLPVRDYYLAIGEAYTQGFVAGFFFCFFLALAAVALASWAGLRGSRRAAIDPPSLAARATEG
jgi:hypothetical protein